MGSVVLARDDRLHRDVAVKVVDHVAWGGIDARQVFLREARAMAGVQPPNVVTISTRTTTAGPTTQRGPAILFVSGQKPTATRIASSTGTTMAAAHFAKARLATTASTQGPAPDPLHHHPSVGAVPRAAAAVRLSVPPRALASSTRRRASLVAGSMRAGHRKPRASARPTESSEITGPPRWQMTTPAASRPRRAPDGHVPQDAQGRQRAATSPQAGVWSTV